MKYEIEILMMDGCTKNDAEKHLKNGTIVFDDFEEKFEIYMEEWGCGEDKIQEFQEMIKTKIPVLDWGVVENEGHTYYIQYVL